MTENSKAGRTWNWQPTALVLLFLGPLFFALVLYYGSDRWRPDGGTNHGFLITPPVVLPQLQPVAGAADQDAGDLRGRWTLIYVDSGSCEARCSEALYRGRQTREALGRNMERVERLYVRRGPASSEAAFEEQDGLRVMSNDERDARELLAALPPELAMGDDLLLVDPLGNLMMRFPLDDDPKGMLTDLKRLLKLSGIG